MPALLVDHFFVKVACIDEENKLKRDLIFLVAKAEVKTNDMKKMGKKQGFFRQVVQITVARLPTQILNDLRKFSKVLQIFPSILRLS